MDGQRGQTERKRPIVLRTLLAITLTSGLVIGADAGHAAQGIRGYYDPVARTFTPLAPRIARTAALALTKYSGTFKITVSVKVEPQIPANVQLVAYVTVTAHDPVTDNPSYQYLSNVGNVLTRSGNAGTVAFTVPYVYELSDPKASVTFQLSVAERGTSPTTQFQPTNGRITTIAVPKNGATTQVLLGETL